MTRSAREFIEEWIGYCMTEETRSRKGAMLIGPKRSGKGTICHVIRQWSETDLCRPQLQHLGGW